MEKILEAASAYIEQDGRVLTIEREGGKYKRYRSMPHGGVEPGETPEQAAVRETEEEAGYLAEIVKKMFEYHGKNSTGKDIRIHVYECKTVRKLRESTMNLQWIQRDELAGRDDIVPTLKQAVAYVSDLEKMARSGK